MSETSPPEMRDRVREGDGEKGRGGREGKGGRGREKKRTEGR